LYAALTPHTGEASQRHTSQEFVAFLEEVVATQPAGREVHVMQHASVTRHFTPTYSSWLNQVESWFSKLQRDVIDRGIFTSVADLKRKILRYYPSLSEDRQTIPVEILRCSQTDPAW